MGNDDHPGVRPEHYFPMVVVLMMFGWWARATHGIGLTAIIVGVWLLMASVAGAVLILRRWNRWWVWIAVAPVFVLPTAAALELITIAENS